ncbi:hypothetical protein DL768_010613 [Monosporascus sp. mg162]|nr:hypothetical protein DL768_010613 [Monosporascus sp. mg162]
MKDGKIRIDKDGDSICRRVYDYRQLNDITIKNGYFLTLMDTIKENISKAKWFTALDLPDGYYLVRMAKSEKWKTAFKTIHGLYEYKVMPQGLTNAPASFQHMLITILRKFLDKFVFVYLDDILIYSETLEEHKKHVAQVLKALEKANLLIQIQDSKIKAVKNWPIPDKATVTDVRQFLGFTGYVRSLIKDFGKIAKPLTNLTTKEYTGKEFEFPRKAKEAMQTLKNQITSAPVIKLPNHHKKKRLKTDASDETLGAVLKQQENNGKWHPVAYYSKALKDAESRYPIYDKELLAVIMALKEWEPYLSGTKEPFDIYSDHKNLTYFITTQDLNKRHENWMIFLSKFNFKIHHIKGKENIQADILSRRGDYDIKVPKRRMQMLQPTKESTLRLCEILKKPTPELLAQFRSSYNSGKQKEIKQLKGQSKNQLLYHGKIYVPQEQQKQFVKEFHGNPLHGHQGIFKTTKRLQEKYDFPGLRETVKQVIKDCNICNKAKAARHKPYGLLQPTKIPNKAWNTIAWDFITGLPLSKDPVTGVQYDGI